MLVIAALLMPLASQAQEWSGQVIAVQDGDTLTVLDAQNQAIKIRLVEIDAPEKSQDYGQKSKQSLSDLCFGKQAKVDDKGLDKYKRTLGRVTCDGIDANAEQVRLGLAWAYRKYLTDPKIADLEQAAKAEKIGLWADGEPIPPWEFRHRKK